MLEMLVVVGLVGAVVGLGALLLLPWETLAVAGLWLIALGFLFGLPTGAWYHVELYRSLKPLGLLPEDWFWNPIQYNDDVPEADYRRVMALCYCGAAGFFVIVVGMVVLGAAVAVQFVRP